MLSCLRTGAWRAPSAPLHHSTLQRNGVARVPPLGVRLTCGHVLPVDRLVQLPQQAPLCHAAEQTGTSGCLTCPWSHCLEVADVGLKPTVLGFLWDSGSG